VATAVRLAHATLVKDPQRVWHRALKEAVAWQRIAVNPATAVVGAQRRA